VQGKVIAPAAATLELLTAAAHALLDLPGTAQQATALAAVAVPSPLFLSTAAPVQPVCSIDLRAGTGVVKAGGGAVHLSATLALAAVPGAVAVRASGSTAAALLATLVGRSHAVVPAVLAGVPAPNAVRDASAAEYWAHPAVLDATLHAGAVLNLRGQGGQPGVMRIPAGVSAYCALQKQQMNGAWASVGGVSSQPDGSSLNNCSSTGALSGVSALCLQELHSKPMVSVRAQHTGKARMAYLVEWRAAEPAQLVTSSGSSHEGVTWEVQLPDGYSPMKHLQPAAASPAEGVAGGVALMQSILKGTSTGSGVRIALFARASAAMGNIAGGSEVAGSHPEHGGVAALRTAGREHPSARMQSVLVDKGSPAAAASFAALGAPNTIDAYGGVVRSGMLQVPRMVAAPESTAAGPVMPSAVNPTAAVSGQVVITGGMGQLGVLVAAWLIEQGACNVQLIGRSAAAVGLPVQLVFSHEAVVSVAMADIGIAADMAGVMTAAAPVPVTAIIHSGGALRDALLTNQTLAGVREVVAPKSSGMHLLMRQAATTPLQTSLLFASTAALIGPAGQANYAAANALLNAAADGEQARGRLSSSIMWGAWAVGMAAADAAMLRRIQSSGVGSIAPAAGLQLLARLLQGTPDTQLVATPFDWPKLQQAAAGSHIPPLFEDFTQLAQQASTPAAFQLPPRQQQQASLGAAVPAAQGPDELMQSLRSMVGGMLGADVAPDQPLMEAGLDSLGE
jgi:hypothetical protein